MKLLTLCFPTYGLHNPLHFNSRGDRIVLAPDEFHRCLLDLGWTIDVVSFADQTDAPLFRSGLRLKVFEEVEFGAYDVYWHMFRDPTQPEVLERLCAHNLDYGECPVINDAFRLRNHEKKQYLPILAKYELAPKVITGITTGDVEWRQVEGEILSELVSSDGQYIESYAFNNNRGDYPSRGSERIVTEYIDNARDGIRSLVRFGYAFGQGFTGFEYFNPERVLVFKTGSSTRWEPYSVPERFRPDITAAMNELGCDVGHIEAIPTEDHLLIVDVNPYPTASGRTLGEISRSLMETLTAYFR